MVVDLKHIRRATYLLKWMGMLLGGSIFLLSQNSTSHAQEPLAREYQIKAVFLYNFTQFVQWPDGSFPDPASPLVIGVLGEDPFGAYLDETIKGEVINNHPLVVTRYEDAEDVKGCHILFVGHDKAEGIQRILDSHLKGAPVLTVSDIDGFNAAGGMIRFLNENGRIRLRINVDAATAANLIISSKLLRLADITTHK